MQATVDAVWPVLLRALDRFGEPDFALVVEPAAIGGPPPARHRGLPRMAEQAPYRRILPGQDA